MLINLLVLPAFLISLDSIISSESVVTLIVKSLPFILKTLPYWPDPKKWSRPSYWSRYSRVLVIIFDKLFNVLPRTDVLNVVYVLGYHFDPSTIAAPARIPVVY
jgi:hypothetical protein